jgi:hypothetical protein
VGEFDSNLEAIKIEIRSPDLSHSDRETYKKVHSLPISSFVRSIQQSPLTCERPSLCYVEIANERIESGT